MRDVLDESFPSKRRGFVEYENQMALVTAVGNQDYFMRVYRKRDSYLEQRRKYYEELIEYCGLNLLNSSHDSTSSNVSSYTDPSLHTNWHQQTSQNVQLVYDADGGEIGQVDFSKWSKRPPKVMEEFRWLDEYVDPRRTIGWTGATFANILGWTLRGWVQNFVLTFVFTYLIFLQRAKEKKMEELSDEIESSKIVDKHEGAVVDKKDKKEIGIVVDSHSSSGLESISGEKPKVAATSCHFTNWDKQKLSESEEVSESDTICSDILSDTFKYTIPESELVLAERYITSRIFISVSLFQLVENLYCVYHEFMPEDYFAEEKGSKERTYLSVWLYETPQNPCVHSWYFVRSRSVTLLLTPGCLILFLAWPIIKRGMVRKVNSPNTTITFSPYSAIQQFFSFVQSKKLMYMMMMVRYPILISLANMWLWGFLSYHMFSFLFTVGVASYMFLAVYYGSVYSNTKGDEIRDDHGVEIKKENGSTFTIGDAAFLWIVAVTNSPEVIVHANDMLFIFDISVTRLLLVIVWYAVVTGWQVMIIMFSMMGLRGSVSTSVALSFPIHALQIFGCLLLVLRAKPFSLEYCAVLVVITLFEFYRDVIFHKQLKLFVDWWRRWRMWGVGGTGRSGQQYCGNMSIYYEGETDWYDIDGCNRSFPTSTSSSQSSKCNFPLQTGFLSGEWPGSFKPQTGSGNGGDLYSSRGRVDKKFEGTHAAGSASSLRKAFVFGEKIVGYNRHLMQYEKLGERHFGVEFSLKQQDSFLHDIAIDMNSNSLISELEVTDCMLFLYNVQNVYMKIITMMLVLLVLFMESLCCTVLWPSPFRSLEVDLKYLGGKSESDHAFRDWHGHSMNEAYASNDDTRPFANAKNNVVPKEKFFLTGVLTRSFGHEETPIFELLMGFFIYALLQMCVCTLTLWINRIYWLQKIALKQDELIRLEMLQHSHIVKQNNTSKKQRGKSSKSQIKRVRLSRRSRLASAGSLAPIARDAKESLERKGMSGGSSGGGLLGIGGSVSGKKSKSSEKKGPFANGTQSEFSLVQGKTSTRRSGLAECTDLDPNNSEESRFKKGIASPNFSKWGFPKSKRDNIGIELGSDPKLSLSRSNSPCNSNELSLQNVGLESVEITKLNSVEVCTGAKGQAKSKDGKKSTEEVESTTAGAVFSLTEESDAEEGISFNYSSSSERKGSSDSSSAVFSEDSTSSDPQRHKFPPGAHPSDRFSFSRKRSKDHPSRDYRYYERCSSYYPGKTAKLISESGGVRDLGESTTNRDSSAPKKKSSWKDGFVSAVLTSNNAANVEFGNLLFPIVEETREQVTTIYIQRAVNQMENYFIKKYIWYLCLCLLSTFYIVFFRSAGVMNMPLRNPINSWGHTADTDHCVGASDLPYPLEA